MGKIKDGRLFLPVIGSFLRGKREKLGLTQENVEAETKIKRYNIARYEKGEVDMPTSKMPELCQLYQCRMAECGKWVDAEMDFADVAKDVLKSKFLPYQYMAFASDTPMVSVEEEILSEKEFFELIKATTAFTGWGLNETGIPEERYEQLKQNCSFFMVEFIKLNEANLERRKRLIDYCNAMLKEYNGK